MHPSGMPIILDSLIQLRTQYTSPKNDYINYHILALLWIGSMSAIMEETYNSLKDLTTPLENQIEITDKYQNVLKLGHLIRDIDRIQPMRPMGLFSVDRSILTSMVSVSITYIIVLVQFKLTLFP